MKENDCVKCKHYKEYPKESGRVPDCLRLNKQAHLSRARGCGKAGNLFEPLKSTNNK